MSLEREMMVIYLVMILQWYCLSSQKVRIKCINNFKL